MSSPSDSILVPKNEASNAHRRIIALDGIRGLAILAVMFHHFTVVLPGGLTAEWIARFSEFGAHGVDLFFMLSGFLITSQLLGPNLDRRRIGGFYLRRGLRIIPLYYTILFLVFMVLPIALQETGFTQKLATQIALVGNWPWYVLFVSNLLNAFDGKFTNPALDVSWSLAIEMQFYLAWPLVVRVCSRRTLKVVIWTIILASPFLRAAAWSLGANWIQILVLPFLRADILMWGGLLAIWMDERQSIPNVGMNRVRAGLPWTAAVILVILLAGGWNRQNVFTSTVGYSLIALAIAGLCARALTMPGHDFVRRLFECRFLVFFSTYAYGLYLVHLPIRALLRDVVFKPTEFAAWPMAPLTGQIAFYALAGIASLLPAVACWHFIENPGIRVGHLLSSLIGRPRATIIRS